MSDVVSRRVELSRFGGAAPNATVVALSEGQRYVRAVEDEPLVAVDVDATSHEPEVLVQLGIVADPKTTAEQRATAVAKLSAVADRLLGTLRVEGGELLQVDVVVGSPEVGIVPFEAFTNGGEPVAQKGDLVVTRRVRGAFAARAFRWPHEPRILFAYATPPGNWHEVPHDPHLEALREALRPWLGPLAGYPQIPNEPHWLTVIPKASLEKLRKACAAATKERRPYTHVHLLAHGAPIERKYLDNYFGLALHADDGDERRDVSGVELVEALGVEGAAPTVITLAVCDSANEQSVLTRGSSLAHELHTGGVPVVVASQLPLSFPGSVVMAREIYASLLRGEDVRQGLASMRTALFASRGAEGADHDWLKPVAYVRLPEGYADDLDRIRLEVDLGHMRAFGAWFRHLVDNDLFGHPGVLAHTKSLITGSIGTLEARLAGGETDSEERVEALGLCASAHKQLAELYHQLGHAELCLAALAESLRRYREGYEEALSHFWTGTQALALEAVMTGTIGEPWRWQACWHAAERSSARAEEFWAFGSLIELEVMATLVGLEPRVALIDGWTTSLVERSKKHAEDVFPLTATVRQLRRHVAWWTPQNGYWNGAPQATGVIARCEGVLAVLEEAIAVWATRAQGSSPAGVA